jgi:hypothetical protein
MQGVTTAHLQQAGGESQLPGHASQECTCARTQPWQCNRDNNSHSHQPATDMVHKKALCPATAAHG